MRTIITTITVPKTGTITATGSGATVEVTNKATADGAETTVVVIATVAAMVQAMETAAKATVLEDAETVEDDTTDMEIVVVDAELVVTRALMVVIATIITTIMKSTATKTWDYTAEHMGIDPINPINAIIPPTDNKTRQRSQT